MCRVLEVSRSGFYASRNRIRPTPREIADAELADDIRRISEESRGTYGRPRIVAKLKKEGHTAGKGRVTRLMKATGIRGRVRRRFKVTTDSNHEWPLAPNTLDREFDVQSLIQCGVQISPTSRRRLDGSTWQRSSISPHA